MICETDWPWLRWNITGPGEVRHGWWYGIYGTRKRSIEWLDDPEYSTPRDILWAAVLKGDWVICPALPTEQATRVSDYESRSTEELKQAIRALEAALASDEVDQRLYCIHNGRMHIQLAHDAIVEEQGVNGGMKK